MIKLLTDAVKVLLKNVKLTLFLYFIHVLFAIMLVAPLYFSILNLSNHSLALNSVAYHFDIKILGDFLVHNGAAFKPFLSLFLIICVIYFIIYNFVIGGTIDSLLNKRFDFTIFLKQSQLFFKRNLMISLRLIFLLTLMTVFSFMILSIVLAITREGGEIDMTIGFFIGLFLGYLIFSWALLCGQYARIFIVNHSEMSAGKAFNEAIKFVYVHPKSMILYLIVQFLVLVVMLCYLYFHTYVQNNTWFMVFVFFVLQQIIIYKRVFLNTLNYNLALDFLNNNNGNY